MNEMVGRVVQAMADNLKARDNVRARQELTGVTIDVDLEALARAAIAAMREPSKAMLSTGWQHTAHPCWEADVADTWRAMIDAALAD